MAAKKPVTQAAIQIEQPAEGPKLVLVPANATTIAPPFMVAKAKRGAELKAIASAVRKELEGIDDEFKKLFEERDTRELTDAKGNAIAVLNHSSRSILHQKELKAAHPLIVEKFTWPNESDSVGYVAKP